MDREEYGKMLREVYLNVLIGIVASVAIVMGIFYSSKVSYEFDIREQELRRQQAEMARNPTIAAWTLENKPEYWEGIFISEYRELAKMESGEEYIVGQLRELDREGWRSSGFTMTLYDRNDEVRWHYPPLTFHYRNYLHIECSLSEQWLTVGPTAMAPKSKQYLYYPEETDSADAKEGWGQGMTSVYLPVKDTFDERYFDDAYNYIEEERLGDVYEGIPEAYADRTRRVWVYHMFATAYNEDPRDKKSQDINEIAKITVRVRYYDAWDLSEQEFTGLPISDYNFAPHLTVELVD